jgi:bifunctional non-homologous end joining protein LigD
VITHPDKLLFPQDGITKGELASYYDLISPAMLPHICGRPITMERYHRGIGEKGFFQKDVSKGFPEWLKRVDVPKKGGSVHHPLVCDAHSLVWLARTALLYTFGRRARRTCTIQTSWCSI